MNVLVTGGTGVLGQKVVQALLERGVTPTVLSRKVRTEATVNSVQGDLLEPSSLSSVLTSAQVIIHCATNPSKVDLSYNPFRSRSSRPNSLTLRSRVQRANSLIWSGLNPAVL